MSGPVQSQALGDAAARNLADVTKTVPQMATITPRWLVHLLAWVPVEAGIYRVNKVKHPEDVDVVCSNYDESPLPTTFVDYEENPREYILNSVSTILDVHTRVSDLYSQPARPDQGAAAADHRGDQGAPGGRADQQPELRADRATVLRLATHSRRWPGRPRPTTSTS